MKTILRKTMRRGKKWLQDEPDPIAEERARFPKFAYGELNATLLEILKRRGGAVRHNYTWAVLQAAYLAKTLGLQRISALEFGVAGGKGLISLEATAEEVQRSLGVAVEVYGFDTGQGLPKPTDYRDLPHLYEPNTYSMDQTELKGRLQKAKLVLGLIEDTLAGFIRSNPAPIGFVAIDVDLYSSTVATLKVFEADQKILLPRVHCYFDDILGFSFAEFNGERLALKEFNDSHPARKISPIHGLRHFIPKPMADSPWVEGIYLTHILDHDLYGHDDGLVLHKNESL